MNSSTIANKESNKILKEYIFYLYYTLENLHIQTFKIFGILEKILKIKKIFNEKVNEDMDKKSGPK